MVLDIRRHAELFDADTFDTPITVIGAGATGSWLVLQLAKLGIRGDLITVYDFDTVEEHNVPNQVFGIGDLPSTSTDQPQLKTEALQRHIAFLTGTVINTKPQKFTNQRLSGYVFLMVDSMSARKEIFDNSIKLKSSVKHLVEPRMGLNEGRIYNVNPMDMNQVRKYEACWYSDDEAEVSACGTSQTVITTAMAVASICTRQLINRHAGVELDNEILVDFMYNNVYPTRW